MGRKQLQPSSHSNARQSGDQFPLQSLLIASFVVPVVGAIGLTGYLSYRNGQQAIEDLAQQLMGEASERVQNQLSTYLSNAQVINRLNANAIQTGQLNSQDPNALTRHFWEQRFLFDNVCGAAMYFGTPQGEFTGLSRHRPSKTWRIGRSGQSTQGHYFSYATDAQGQASRLLKKDHLFDPRVRPWYRAATQARTTTWSQVYPDTNQQSLKIALSQPVYDATGKLQGVLGVDCLFAKLDDLLRQTKVGQSGVIFITERSGALIATSTDHPSLNQQNLRLNIFELNHPLIQSSAKLLRDSQALAGMQQSQAFAFDHQGQSYFLRVTSLPKDVGLDWQIVVVVPESDFMARVDANTRTTLWLCLGALSLAIAVGGFTARRVTRPIIQMSAASRQIVSGELEQPIASSAIQEVTNLVDTFNWMSQQIRASRQQLQDYARSLEANVSERTQALEYEIQQHKQTETALQHSKEALKLIVEGTAAQTGDNFFRACVHYLAEVLQVQYAIVSEFANPEKTRVRSLAYWTGSDWSKPIEYPIRATPCETVLAGQIRYYPHDVQTQFADDHDLIEMGVVSYLGMPLMNSVGQILGHLAVLDTKPMSTNPDRELILKIFAARAGAELERKHTEEVQRQSEKKFRSIIENVNDVIYILNPDGTFAYLSPSLSDALHYEPTAIIGTHFTPMIHPDYLQRCINAVQRLVETGETIWGLEYLIKTKQNDWRWYISNISAVYDDAGKVQYCVGVARDVTDRKLMEEELRRAKEAADAASKAKSEFLANMSHELRSPLNAILGFSQLLHRSQTLNPEQQENVDTIIRSGEHLLTLINNVLDLSKIEAGQTTLNASNFNLHQLLHDVETMFTLRAEEKKLQLVCDRHPQLPQYICTDQVKLRQVLINLLSNAVKFTEQGKITLRVKPEDADRRIPKTESSSIEASQVSISFEVEDTGIGIAPEESNDLFIAFSQTQSGKTHEGTGLGLAISRQFVELMGGTISASSVLHQGTTFRFNIQAAIVASTDQHPPVRQVIGLESGQSDYRILVVDDKSANRQLLIKLLSPLGFELREASNGQTAIAIFQEWEPHLIWMDMRMPIMDGYEATKQIKATTKGQATAVIALTASALEEQKAIVLSAGCDGFIRKPFQQAEIFAAMQEHIGVRYIYASSEAKSLKTESNSQPMLSSESLAEQLRSLSTNLINELHKSLQNVDLDSLSDLIKEINNTNSELASVLKKQINNFEYEQILAAIQMIH